MAGGSFLFSIYDIDMWVGRVQGIAVIHTGRTNNRALDGGK